MAETTDPSPFRVLGIDGGGIRGIIPAMVLTAIEKGLRPGGRLHQTFDLIVGTSTGAIVADGTNIARLQADGARILDECADLVTEVVGRLT